MSIFIVRFSNRIFGLVNTLIQTERQTDIQIYRQMDTQTNRRTYRQTRISLLMGHNGLIL